MISTSKLSLSIYLISSFSGGSVNLSCFNDALTSIGSITDNSLDLAFIIPLIFGIFHSAIGSWHPKIKGRLAFIFSIPDGKKVEFDNVLFISDKGKVKIGKPTIKGSKVTGEVLSQLKDDKVIVFKKKRRKGYKVKNGHRQQMTKILIKDIK